MKLKTDEGHITVTEADGIQPRDYWRMSSDGVLLLVDMGKRHIGVTLTTDQARKFAKEVIDIADAHDAVMATKAGE